MKMKLVGLSKVNEGESKKENPPKPYKMRDAHFIGKGIGVEGQSVAKVTLNLLEDAESLPELLIGSLYIVDLSDKGYLRGLELLEKLPAQVDSGKPKSTGFNSTISNG